MDGILGAMGKEDIGFYFPDSDPQYKNASSRMLTRKILDVMEQENYRIGNIDITLFLEKPKIKNYRQQIKKSLSEILNLKKECIGLKATTTEKMGAIGRGEGIGCSVTLLLEKIRDLYQPVKMKEQSIPEKIEVFTDGACLGNPGPGGWGVIINLGGREEILSGSDRFTTNNRMELLGVIRALEFLSDYPDKSIAVYTDSNYVKNGITSWIKTWKKNGWKNAKKEPVANQELWKELDGLNEKLNVEYHWVKGHSGHPQNERCDEIAREEAKEAENGRESCPENSLFY
jgi:ribonuclease HI